MPQTQSLLCQHPIHYTLLLSVMVKNTLTLWCHQLLNLSVLYTHHLLPLWDHKLHYWIRGALTHVSQKNKFSISVNCIIVQESKGHSAVPSLLGKNHSRNLVVYPFLNTQLIKISQPQPCNTFQSLSVPSQDAYLWLWSRLEVKKMFLFL